jgi:hypothetical protein
MENVPTNDAFPAASTMVSIWYSCSVMLVVLRNDPIVQLEL